MKCPSTFLFLFQSDIDIMKNVLSVLGLLSFSSFAMAQGNVINFVGEVSSQSCDVAINGSANNPGVYLPTVATSALAASGQVSGETPFTISVTGCTGAESKTITPQFMPIGADGVLDSGLLVNQGTANNVALELLNSDGSQIVLQAGAPVAGMAMELPENVTSASQEYQVRYQATGQATAGTVSANLQYAISYL